MSFVTWIVFTTLSVNRETSDKRGMKKIIILSKKLFFLPCPIKSKTKKYIQSKKRGVKAQPILRKTIEFIASNLVIREI